ncbi:hypothetical protein UA32_12535 [Photobacterium angustum]|uniref:Uncharacterized protein n=1 Tax=Photobacterium angustum TaxID=661 RepID=A0ABX5H130_PHOAN|nr:hypothetical protein UA32_12535 [Photobacterium angustum]PSX07042.1 hypothetical protein C0W27_15855 [Photobacterium angustum]
MKVFKIIALILYLLSLFKVFDIGYRYSPSADNSLSTVILQCIVLAVGIMSVLLITHDIKFRKKISV